jgi:Subtilase family
MNPHSSAPYSPADIAEAYDFDELYDSGIRGSASRASTIAIVTAYTFDPQDLTDFWQAFGIDRSPDSVTVIPIGGNTTTKSDESTLDAEWAGAMAPQSPIIAYIGADASFTTFLAMYDRAVSDDRAAVISTSWGTCENNLPQRYLDQAAAIFQKAAALGISIVAASGDGGAYDCGPGIVSVDFPASHPLVTAVGGTALKLDADGSYGSESAWEMSGAGSSTVWPQPLWQAQNDAHRALADVAFNADPRSGYYVCSGEQWWQFGGTSVGAPCWAALLALTNQEREQNGRTTLGVPAPRFCELVDQDINAFRDVTTGGNGVQVATAGWDPVTGWGTPDAKRLADALSRYTATDRVSGGATISTYLSLGAHQTPIARGMFTSRCANSQLDVMLNEVPAGRYDLLLDGNVIRSIHVDGDGHTTIQVSTVDPRGHTLSLAPAGTTNALFSSQFPQTQPRPLALREGFDTVSSEPARGTAIYRARRGLGQLAIRVYGLPANDYNLIVGQRRVATLWVRESANATIGTIQFNSRPGRGELLDFDPLCQTIQVARKATLYLRIDAFGATRGLCGQ